VHASGTGNLNTGLHFSDMRGYQDWTRLAGLDSISNLSDSLTGVRSQPNMSVTYGGP
jgi:hypothetical protein